MEENTEQIFDTPVENFQNNREENTNQPVENFSAEKPEKSNKKAKKLSKEAKELEKAKVENAELKDLLQHTRADFENYRKQIEKQQAQAKELARYATVERFLPLVDDMARALETYPEQLEPLQKNFQKTLADLGLTMIDSNPGTEFNPDYHEAVSMDDADGDTEIVAETLRPGYLYEGNVLRPAMVKVSHQ